MIYNRLNTYFKGISWFILSIISSVTNDIIMKYLSLNLDHYEIICLRFLFSFLTIFFFILCKNQYSFKTKYFFVHIKRGILLYCAIILWIYGLKVSSIFSATIINLAAPLFNLTISCLFLNEHIIWQRWIGIICGFIGISISLEFYNESYNNQSWIFILSSIIFVFLDIINKKLVIKESITNSMFYSSLTTFCISIPLATIYCTTPTAVEFILLIILGISSNLVLLFLLKSLSLIDYTATAPYKYLEIIVASIAGYFVFHEMPSNNTIYGILMIIPTTLFIIFSEKNNIKCDQNININK